MSEAHGSADPGPYHQHAIDPPATLLKNIKIFYFSRNAENAGNATVEPPDDSPSPQHPVSGAPLRKVPVPSQECLVCGAPAPHHIHFGGRCCFSCRAFFRRTVLRYPDPEAVLRCISGTQSCRIDRHHKAGLAIKNPPKKKPPKKATKNGFLGFFKCLIFYENNTNFFLFETDFYEQK